MTDARYMRPGLEFARDKATEEVGELMEALGRLLASLGKTGRWGWSSVNPELLPAEQETNAAWVEREMADVRHALNNLEREMRSAGAIP